MIGDKKVLAVIPARGGSKGVPRKNIRLLNQKPLISWTIDEAHRSAFIDRLIVSTDDTEIAVVASQHGAEVPFFRPAEIAADHTTHVEPILHALSLMHGYDYVVMLQPTSPLRQSVDIDGCISLSASNDGAACVTVVETDKTPYWMYTMKPDQRLDPILTGHAITRRQDAPQTYNLNGAVYVCSVERFIREKAFLTSDTLGYVMPKDRSYDIDSLFDFKLVEWIMEQQL
ncbi:N-acylneuraminate cytidylyltransferase [Cohnella sp. OV330]|uniref:acylneuraminate cytidylyltransferase family protein n=1 Tax=Cohnella sp. OV330 TaxID=1855288 RepID=UPI0008E404B4|nr:acylneuraminate cytidylyltransferase family protein [Cohnella sp. OV330]SFB47869.1 N-acylneuraminate cytidylyltransferase [Cohnella sp. OV330]